MVVFYVILMFVAPIIGGVLLGFIQLGFYRIVRRSAEATPSFPVLFARGLLAFFLVAAALALATRAIPG
jgi:hypothetical protein